MSGDGPLRVRRGLREGSHPHSLVYGHPEREIGLIALSDSTAEVVEAQLDRARRCAEAETNLLLCSLALSSMEDERDDARAERDAALAEVERLAAENVTLNTAADGWRDKALRAELARKSDLTELSKFWPERLRQMANGYFPGRYNGTLEGVADFLDRLLAADPAPAPDKWVRPDGCICPPIAGDGSERYNPPECPVHGYEAQDIAAPDTVTITVSREAAEVWVKFVGGSFGDALRAALGADQ